MGRRRNLDAGSLGYQCEPAGPEVVTGLAHVQALMAAQTRYDEALRAADAKLQAERDRRYAEVALEREKALKIKETADLAALSLAREIQDYKDEKANNLRSQIEGERGNYATQTDLRAVTEKFEATIKPLQDYVASTAGSRIGSNVLLSYLIAAASLVLAVVSIITRGG